MPIKLSPSSINLFMECRRCFWLKLKKGVERPSGPFPSLPSGVDKKVKAHFDRYRRRGKTPPELEELDLDARLLEDEDFLSDCRNWRSDPCYRDPGKDVVVRGEVDDLLRAEDGSIIVLDYKTRGYSPKDEAPDYYRRQINLYSLILQSNGYPIADFGLLLYYYPDRILENGNFVFHNEIRKVPVDIEGAKELVRKAVETLNGTIPDANPDCDFCRWSANEF